MVSPSTAPDAAAAGSPGPAAAGIGADTGAGTGAHNRASGAAASSTGGGLLDSLLSIGRDLPGLLGDRVELLALELQRAGRALAQLVAILVAIAVLGVTAWLLLWAALVGALVALGLPVWAGTLLAVAVNGVVVVLLVGRAMQLMPLLRLPATRRHLTPRPEPSRVPEPGASAGPDGLRPAGSAP